MTPADLQQKNRAGAAQCPAPLSQYESIVMGHGGGGRLGADLLQKLFLPAFDNPVLTALEDQAEVRVGGARLAFTTDSFVVRPIFFPGGDIGTLAVNGTVNDLAVGGATPLFLAAAFVLEEGLAVPDLKRVVESMGRACREAGVALVTGDTKVVDRGKGDKVFITTTGIGAFREGISLSIKNIRPGDKILVSGTMGDHGVAIMSVREGLEFESLLESDTAPLTDLTKKILESCSSVRCMRDPTRGGLAATLNEWAAGSQTGIRVEERSVPVKAAVKGACEVLGLDPLYVANEGKLAVVVPAENAAAVLDAMRAHPRGRDAAIVGEVVSEHPGAVTIRSSVGGMRLLAMPAGEQLPRIC